MDFVGSRYYKLNQRLLLLVGLWPYEYSIFKYCQVFLCNIVITLMMVCQITKLITWRGNIDLILKILSPIVFYAVCLIKYYTFYILAGKIRYIMNHVEKDWNMLKDKKELNIIRRYTSIGSIYTLGFTILACGGIIIIVIIPMIPIILDTFMPLNVSRPRQQIFPGEYFVDQQKYFYVLSLNIDISVALALTTLIGTESLYVVYVQHACGMFQIASYRLNQAFEDNLLQTCTPKKRAIIVCKKIIEAIYIHKRAIEFSEYLWSSLAMSYSILLIIGVLSLLVNLLCLFQTIIFLKEVNEIMKLITFLFGHIFYFFLGNYVGQILIDHSTGIFEKTYITRWHDAPLQAQKLLPIIMQRSMKSCKMDIGGLFIPSFEGFAALMSTTMSYFTVLWSVHK